MLTNLLTNSLPAGYQDIDVGDAAIDALIGFLVVFAGIAFLIFVVWLVGRIMVGSNTRRKEQKPALIEKQETAPIVEEEDSVDEETVAAIMAVLMAYYEKNNPKCEFTVKRIKRIRRNNYA